MNALYRHTVGHGPDVVLLHGWGMHSGVWKDVVEGLIDQHRVTLLDLPGHGYSRAAEGRRGLDDLSAAVLAATPARAAWVGWSLGGLVTQRIALDAPERIRRMALVSSTPCFMRRPDWPHGVVPNVLRLFAEQLRQDHRAVLNRFIALEVHGSERAAVQLRQLKVLLFQHGEPERAALEDGLTILETTDLRADLPRMTGPSLLLMGQRDQLTPVAAAEAMRDAMPNARLHVFPGAGHAPFFSHLPEFMAQLGSFLDE